MPATFAFTDTREAVERRWAVVRGVLGVAQMLGASAGAVLLAVRGVTTWTLAVVTGTGVLTTVSVLLFGAKR